MGHGTWDRIAGNWKQFKGDIRTKWGDLTDNEGLRDEGAADEAKGDLQEGFGKAKRKVGDTIEDMGEDIKR